MEGLNKHINSALRHSVRGGETTLNERGTSLEAMPDTVSSLDHKAANDDHLVEHVGPIVIPVHVGLEQATCSHGSISQATHRKHDAPAWPHDPRHTGLWPGQARSVSTVGTLTSCLSSRLHNDIVICGEPCNASRTACTSLQVHFAGSVVLSATCFALHL